MKLFFPESESLKAEAATFGFHSHATRTRAALARAGALVDRKEDADAALWVGPPDFFRATPGLRNVCYTAIEGTLVAREEAAPLKRADLVLCPCTQNAEVLSVHHANVHVVPLGVDRAAFPFFERQEPGPDEPFRFLFVGNLHPSKGALTLLQAFNFWLESGTIPRNVELYIKTATEAKRDGNDFRGLSCQTAQGGAFKASDTRGLPGIVIDNRNLPAAELLDVFRTAHAFALPSIGEGWGLSLTEGMATGLPSIFTGWSAMNDYADERTGFPLTAAEGGYRLDSIPWRPIACGARVSVRALVKKMEYVYSHYPEALERGRRASERMHAEFTWARAAEKLIKVCREKLN